MKTYADLAKFIEELLEDRLQSPCEIDEFESVPLARSPDDKFWPLEVWRRNILHVAFAPAPREVAPWYHPESEPQLSKLAEVLRYIDEREDSELSSINGPKRKEVLEEARISARRTNKNLSIGQWAIVGAIISAIFAQFAVYRLEYSMTSAASFVIGVAGLGALQFAAAAKISNWLFMRFLRKG